MATYQMGPLATIVPYRAEVKPEFASSRQAIKGMKFARVQFKGHQLVIIVLEFIEVPISRKDLMERVRRYVLKCVSDAFPVNVEEESIVREYAGIYNEEVLMTALQATVL
jgi:hypothetical protein